jgi:GTPase Era involved in 16S rRNA processing
MKITNFSPLLTAFAKAEQPLMRWLPEGDTEALGLRLKEKSTQNKPRIMVYGYYNAGKSTLINALIGESKAAMADRPLTAKVDEYEWSGYTLLDTPGIDAPIEHEGVANDELDRCDVVLFVLASGGAVEEKATWAAISNIIKRGRSLILIVNNKTGLDTESKDYIALTEKLRTALQDETGDDAVVNRVPICLVDAGTALKGRLENKPALIEHSCVLDLEAKLLEFLEKNKDRASIIESCRQDLSKVITTAQSELSEKTADPKAEQQRALTKARESVEAEKRRLNISLGEAIDSSRIAEKPKAVLMIRDVIDSNNSRRANEGQTETAANEIVTNFGKRMEVALVDELGETKEKLTRITDKLLKDKLFEEASWRSARANSNNFEKVGVNATEVDDTGVFKAAMKDAFKKIPTGNLEGLTQQGVKIALEKGKTWLPELFKGVGPKTMGKYAATAGRWATPIIAAGTAIFDVYSVFRQEGELKRQIERQAVAIEDAAEKFINDLSDSYREQIREVISTIFMPIFGYLEEQERNFQIENTSIQKDEELLREAKTLIA